MALKLTWEKSTQLQRRKNCRQLRRILTQLLKDIAERDFLPLLFPRKSPAMKEKEFRCIPKCRRTFNAVSSLQPVLLGLLKSTTTVLSVRTSGYFRWGQIKVVFVFRLPFWIFKSQHRWKRCFAVPLLLPTSWSPKIQNKPLSSKPGLLQTPQVWL